MVLINDIIYSAVKQYSANVESGARYCIKNDKGATVIDLSAGDGKSIIGWTENKGSNQVWEVEKQGSGWHIKNVASKTYLSIEGDVRDGTKVVASADPFWWYIWKDDKTNGIRILVPNTNQNLDLSDHGNKTPGTPITLWSQSSGPNQLWHFEKV